MRVVDLIRKKRDGHRLTRAEIDHLVAGLATGEVPDYQWSALLMAIVWRGMDDAETAALTHAMIHSGRVLDLPDVPGPKVDKHSTGGVGDKTSLVLAPIAAACGVVVPKLSGRGLGHTGGTLDKLESISGFTVRLDTDRFRKVLADCGLVLAGQTADLAPADKKLYALRDATATVESIPLITASILSKKLAVGIDGLVLDVKTGDGAFLTRHEDALALAQSMGRIAQALGKPTVARLSRMDQPLGHAVGNAVEVEEAIACLKGEASGDLLDLSIELAAEMVKLAGIEPDLTRARHRCARAVADGSALERFERLIGAQGGDPSVIDVPGRLPQPHARHEILSSRAGFVRHLRARSVGHSAMLLGAGRARADSSIDHAVGVRLRKKVGDQVEQGEPLATLLVNDRTHLAAAMFDLAGAFEIDDVPPTPLPFLLERVEFNGRSRATFP